MLNFNINLMGIFGSKELDRKKQPVEPKQEPVKQI